LRISRPEEAPPWPLDRRRLAYRLRRILPSTKQAINGAVRDVLALSRRCGSIRDHQADLEIALREALANAVCHGNAFDDGKRIFLRCYGAPGGEVIILVRDEGDGFDPAGVPDPRQKGRIHLDHGRGLLLMRELMDYVEYRRAGREVLIYKSGLIKSEQPD
jgi:anti-sigma regulatory factor (Ser/Thr protein kinase)